MMGLWVDSTFVDVLHEIDPPVYRNPAEPDSFVYFLLDHDLAAVKIGWSLDPKRRRRELSRQFGRQLELLGQVKAGYDLERCLHKRFARYRVVGTREWYRSEIVGDLAAILDW
jgi:hypothetical protein